MADATSSESGTQDNSGADAPRSSAMQMIVAGADNAANPLPDLNVLSQPGYELQQNHALKLDEQLLDSIRSVPAAAQRWNLYVQLADFVSITQEQTDSYCSKAWDILIEDVEALHAGNVQPNTVVEMAAFQSWAQSVARNAQNKRTRQSSMKTIVDNWSENAFILLLQSESMTHLTSNLNYYQRWARLSRKYENVSEAIYRVNGCILAKLEAASKSKRVGAPPQPCVKPADLDKAIQDTEAGLAPMSVTDEAIIKYSLAHCPLTGLLCHSSTIEAKVKKYFDNRDSAPRIVDAASLEAAIKEIDETQILPLWQLPASIGQDHQPADQPTDEPGSQPTDEPGSQPTDEPGSQPTDEPGSQPTDQPGSQPTDQPGSQPADQPGSQPADQPGSQPAIQSGNLTSVQTGVQPSVQTGSQTGSQSQSLATNVAPGTDQTSSSPRYKPSNLLLCKCIHPRLIPITALSRRPVSSIEYDEQLFCLIVTQIITGLRVAEDPLVLCTACVAMLAGLLQTSSEEQKWNLTTDRPYQYFIGRFKTSHRLYVDLDENLYPWILNDYKQMPAETPWLARRPFGCSLQSWKDFESTNLTDTKLHMSSAEQVLMERATQAERMNTPIRYSTSPRAARTNAQLEKESTRNQTGGGSNSDLDKNLVQNSNEDSSHESDSLRKRKRRDKDGDVKTISDVISISSDDDDDDDDDSSIETPSKKRKVSPKHQVAAGKQSNRGNHYLRSKQKVGFSSCR
jgi:hypothetical protein